MLREEGEPNLNLKVGGVIARTRVGVSDRPLVIVVVEGGWLDPATEAE